MSTTASNQGILYVVATPIGNLGDMVPRAVETLQTVALIAAEDTRHSSRLLSHFAIKTPCIAYHDHSDDSRVDQLVAKMQAGESIALISDAGTPLVSDPGYRLVRSARQAGIQVVPIPGACAMIAALSAAGLPSDRFAFEGFLPAKQIARCTQLQSLAADSRTLIFYEAPHRILETLQDMVQVFGPEREVVIAREITKTFETIKGDSVAALVDWVAADSNQQRGEIVLLVHGAPKQENETLTPEQIHTMKVLLDELPVKQAASIGAKLTGLKKNFLYDWALQNSK
ncbi:16S rRNA (cytidine(1402)-2'-O)-methyltransferase [Cellvibrio sp. KY-GH-1]|uniref:16S rRNA (cytidine(1402)-2'-O)-methyltransferase n=1 Tax=Cellvibrio sp. KY-GH-1 TaxID=2303332 RepID=UPI0012493B2D|nr:16S rRNA (cytidine(1402)-2'-O)-methyltransferase [Cellvibrio sp. KY-GH-1]QEY16572.1 16S rRNA (cytidine(1402)-2'-O)-methyltransferase [Cellvibrio sp. KY-GH-1]